jgi:hypothetical protein
VAFTAEDAPYVVRTVSGTENGEELVLSDETREPLAGKPLLIDDGGRVRCVVKQGRFWAVFSRSATQAVAHTRDLTPIGPGDARDWSEMPG